MAKTIMPPVTTGTSFCLIPATMNEPNPGSPKSVSVAIAPPMRMPKLFPATVITGRRAFFMACFHMTILSPPPSPGELYIVLPDSLQHAGAGESKLRPPYGSPKAIMGMIYPFQLAMPFAGNQPSLREKTNMSIKPIRKPAVPLKAAPNLWGSYQRSYFASLQRVRLRGCQTPTRRGWH